jgi:hypothetical protein
LASAHLLHATKIAPHAQVHQERLLPLACVGAGVVVRLQGAELLILQERLGLLPLLPLLSLDGARQPTS